MEQGKTGELIKTKDPKSFRIWDLLARREGFEPPAFWSVKLSSHAQIGAVSAPICAFCHRLLGGFSVVSVQPCPLFWILGQNRVRIVSQAAFNVSHFTRLPILAAFVVVSPQSPHGIQNGLQAFAQFRQRILHSRRYFGVDLAVDKSPFSSIARSCAVRTFCDTFPTDFFSSPNRFVPGIKSLRISTFHLSPISVKVVSTGRARKCILCFCCNHFNPSEKFFGSAKLAKNPVTVQSFLSGNYPLVSIW